MNIRRNSLTLIILQCTVILIVGCGAPTHLTQNDGGILLEMVTDASDTVYPPGKALDLRVFENGQVEFDDYSPDELGNTEPTKPQIKRKSISREELFAIEAAITKLEAENPKTTYPPAERIFDARIVTTLTYKATSGMKTIILMENDSHLHLEKKANLYPQALIDLVRLCYKIGASVREAN